jgi:hypothetical protein
LYTFLKLPAQAENPRVGGSIPSLATIEINGLSLRTAPRYLRVGTV